MASSRTTDVGRLSPRWRIVPEIFLGVKGDRPAPKSGNPTAICEMIFSASYAFLRNVDSYMNHTA
jgi:hypothetical protein